MKKAYLVLSNGMAFEGQRIGAEIPNAARWRWVCDMLDIRFALPTAELEEIFWDAAAPCTPTPGMPRLLALLREKGIRTGVISNMGFSGAALTRRLQKTFPEHRFDFVISSADYILRKPDPHIFALGLHRAGCRAEEAWFLGDNLRCDILGAASATMRWIWATPTASRRTWTRCPRTLSSRTGAS